MWGTAFTAALSELGLPTFSDSNLRYVGPILMHAGIPAYCLGDFFRLLVDRRRQDPGLDADSFLAWATAPRRQLRLSQLDKPAERFLLNGGDYAHDIVDRTLDLLDRLTEPDPDFDAVRLPSYMIETARAEQAAGRLDLTKATRSAGNRTSVGIRRQAQPRIALDPYGQGVHVLLPAVGDTPDGVARWKITADGETRTVQSRAMWVGAAETTPQTVFPLDRPVRTVLVSLTGREDLAAELTVVDQADPVLFFGDDGRRLSATVSLPRSQVWIMHPADREPGVRWAARADRRAFRPVRLGWLAAAWASRWKTSRPSACKAAAPIQVEVQARPQLLFGEPLPGVATPFGSPVYPVPPRLRLPQAAGVEIKWYAEIRRVGTSAPLVGRAVDPDDQIDIWEGVPRPVLGAFEITVRGPLGRGLRRTVFIAEGLTVSYQPKLRLLTTFGLAGGEAKVAAAPGATAQPATLRFGPGERARPIEYRTPTESEPLVITPPHVAVLCPAAGVTTWTTSLVHLVTEDFADAGRLLIRVPAPDSAGQAGQNSKLELAVLIRGQQVQAIPVGGQQSPGLAGFDLARAADTIAAHGHAELAVDLGNVHMPVGYVRPRRLASGVELAGRHAGAARRHRGGRLDRRCVPRIRAVATTSRAAHRGRRNRISASGTPGCRTAAGAAPHR